MTEVRDFDFIVVGAGPAGSRAAELLARRGDRVLLLDPKAPWEKPCGGGLTAAALRHTPELQGVDGQWVRSLRVVAPGGASVEVSLRRPVLVVSRAALSRWGLERARAAGAVFRPAAAESVGREGAVWRVRDESGDAHRGRWLIAADGAASRLRLKLAPRLRPELAPTRVTYAGNGHADRAVFLLLAGADGYLWDFPRRDHHSVGVGVPPHTFARESLDAAIAQYRVAEWDEAAEVTAVGAVIATSRWCSGDFEDLGGPDYALLGDAAGLADPATGEGIDYALRSAALAVSAFREEDGFARYPSAARLEFEAEIRRALLLRRWLYAPAVADRLVRWAQRSSRGRPFLSALADAVNEHRSVVRAALRVCLSQN